MKLPQRFNQDTGRAPLQQVTAGSGTDGRHHHTPVFAHSIGKHLYPWVLGLHTFDQINPRHAGQVHIRQQDIRLIPIGRLKGFLRRSADPCDLNIRLTLQK